MATLVKEVLDRMHAINQTVGQVTWGSSETVTLNCGRYWPASVDGKQPYIVPIWAGRIGYEQQPGARYVMETHTFINMLWVKEITVGIPNQTAQQQLEALIPALEAKYEDNENLELSGAPLSAHVMCLPTTIDSILTRDNIVATLQFNYTVTLRHRRT